jgi:ribosomal protein L7/L12
MFDNLLGSMVGVTFGLCLGILITLARTHASVSRIEGRLNVLLKHSGIDAQAYAIEQAIDLVRAGNKIEAIKTLRQFTGCGLAEAKQKVESLA